jgi:hypothetical protein
MITGARRRFRLEVSGPAEESGDRSVDVNRPGVARGGFATFRAVGYYNARTQAECFTSPDAGSRVIPGPGRRGHLPRGLPGARVPVGVVLAAA